MTPKMKEFLDAPDLTEDQAQAFAFRIQALMKLDPFRRNAQHWAQRVGLHPDQIPDVLARMEGL